MICTDAHVKSLSNYLGAEQVSLQTTQLEPTLIAPLLGIFHAQLLQVRHSGHRTVLRFDPKRKVWIPSHHAEHHRDFGLVGCSIGEHWTIRKDEPGWWGEFALGRLQV